MKRIQALWHSLSRKQRVAGYLLGLLLAALAAYMAAGFPSLTPQMALRRAERANMIGPSAILATEIVDPQGRMIVGISSHGYTLYYYRPGVPYDHTAITYREKAEDITVLACTPFGTSVIPVLIFADNSRAVRAELELDLELWQNNRHLVRTYRLEGSKNEHGYFRLDLSLVPESAGSYWEVSAENELIFTVAGILSGDSHYASQPLPATVRLYDKDGNCILSKSMELHGYDIYGGNTDEN